MHVRPCEAKISDAKPENIILHVEKNDLNFEKTSSLIARSITDLAVSLMTNRNNIVVSSIAPGNDDIASEVKMTL